MPRWDEFMRLYLANERRLYGFIMALVPNWADVDDLIQETALVMWSKFDEFQPGTNFSAWSLSIARYRVLNYRKEKKSERRQFSLSVLEAIDNKLHEAVENDAFQNRRAALQHCLSELRPPDREIIDLRYRPGATTKSVSEYLGRSIHSIYKVLNRIHSQLLFCIRHYIARNEPI